jgi:hypothetical protein
MHAKPASPPLCLERCTKQVLTTPCPEITLEITPLQMRWSMSLSFWHTKGGATYWKALGTAERGSLFALTGKATDAVRLITSGITSLRSTGATLYEPYYPSHLAMAYAELG